MNKYQSAIQQWNKAAQKWAASKGHPLKRWFYGYRMKAAAKQMGQARSTEATNG